MDGSSGQVGQVGHWFIRGKWVMHHRGASRTRGQVLESSHLRIFPSFQSHQSRQPSIVPSLWGRLVGAVSLSISSHFLSLLFNACFTHSCEESRERKVRLCNVCRIDPVKFFKKLPTPYIPYRVSNILGYSNYTGDINIIGDREIGSTPRMRPGGGVTIEGS